MDLEFQADTKWNHFAFEADRSKLLTLREALHQSLATADPGALFAFHETYEPMFWLASRRASIEIRHEELRDMHARLATTMAGVDPRGRAAAVARLPWLLEVGASARAATLSHEAWRLLEHSADALERFGRTVGADSPLIEITLEQVDEALERLVSPMPTTPRPAEPSSERFVFEGEVCWPDLFEACLETCLAPLAENLGIRGVYEVFNSLARWREGEDPFDPPELLPRARLIPDDLDPSLDETMFSVGDSGPCAYAVDAELETYASSVHAPEGALSVDAGNSEEHAGLAIIVRRRLQLYASACQAIAERQGALVTWIGKNPAV